MPPRGPGRRPQAETEIPLQRGGAAGITPRPGALTLHLRDDQPPRITGSPHPGAPISWRQALPGMWPRDAPPVKIQAVGGGQPGCRLLRVTKRRDQGVSGISLDWGSFGDAVAGIAGERVNGQSGVHMMDFLFNKRSNPWAELPAASCSQVLTEAEILQHIPFQRALTENMPQSINSL